MLPASNRGVGMNMGFPDVCLTPTPAGPVPIPYPNIALNAQAVAFSPVVSVSGVNALNMGSKIPMTSGDEAGSAHPVFKQMGAYTMGNPVVYVDRLPAINLTCPTTGNTMNNAAGAVVVPSVVNVFYTLARAPRAAPWASADARALGEMVAGGDGGEPIEAAMLDAETGHVRVRVVTADIEGRFFLAARRLGAAGAGALVIDLRACPGGDLDAAVAWAASFLDAGAEITRVEDADGDEIVRRAALPAVHRMPIAVLVDGDTASAAEVFAACLKAHGRARIVGARTFGKGSAQRLVPGAGESFAYVTAARCAAPGGSPIDGVGVEPDLSLAGGDDHAWLEAARASLHA